MYVYARLDKQVYEGPIIYSGQAYLLMLYVLKISSVQMQLCNAILTQLQNEFAKDAHSNYGYVMCAARHETM